MVDKSSFDGELKGAPFPRAINKTSRFFIEKQERIVESSSSQTLFCVCNGFRHRGLFFRRECQTKLLDSFRHVQPVFFPIPSVAVNAP